MNLDGKSQFEDKNPSLYPQESDHRASGEEAAAGLPEPSAIAASRSIDLLTPNGEHEEVPLGKVRAIYFVRDLQQDIEMERKSFLSRPKLDGLWVRLRFRDGESLEGVIPERSSRSAGKRVADDATGFQFEYRPDFRAADSANRIYGAGCSGNRAAEAGGGAAQPRLFNEDEER